jgi:hypothetical protein
LGEKVVFHNSAAIGENSITAIREYFTRDAEPLKEHEFVDFWKSLSEAEKDEFRRADLSK